MVSESAGLLRKYEIVRLKEVVRRISASNNRTFQV